MYVRRRPTDLRAARSRAKPSPQWHRLVVRRLQRARRGGLRVAKYGKRASDTVASAVRRQKKGTLKSSSGRRVTSRKQAVAIGLSEAREKGAKVPPAPRKRGTHERSRKRA